MQSPRAPDRLLSRGATAWFATALLGQAAFIAFIAVFFGGAIAIISCYKGFNCREGAHGVGQACTEAFVASFISILALDFALAVIFKSIYEIFWPIKSIVA